MAAPVKQLSDGNPGGTGLGQSSTDLISFYGVTPVVQRTTTLGTTVATTVAVSTTTGAVTSWGFATSTQANNVISLLNSVYSALTSAGLIGT
jgi:hypothetical protein